MNRYYYLQGDDGRRHCRAVEPTFRCPVGAEAIDGLDEFAAAIGVNPEWLTRKLRHSGGRHRDAEGKLVDTCDSCGHKLTRLGFGCWTMAVPTEPTTNSRLNRAFGGDGYEQVGPMHYEKTKRDAINWIRMMGSE